MHAVLMHSMLIYCASALSMLVLAFATVDHPIRIQFAASPFNPFFDEPRGVL